MFSSGNVYLNSSANYVSKPWTVYDSFISAINKLKEKIYSNIENILAKRKNDNLDELIENLKESFESMEYILSNLDFFKHEYYDFTSIRDMVFYILKNKELLPRISIIKGVLNSFYALIKFKKESSDGEYELKYDEFSSQLVRVEQIFYTKIREPSKNYDEKSLSEMINLLLG